MTKINCYQKKLMTKIDLISKMYIIVISNFVSQLFPSSIGSGFASKDVFLFGQIDMQIKLISGHSAGTVVAN